jgi:hypothetical protein
MSTPLGEPGISNVPKENATSTVLTSSIGAEPGIYMFTGGLTKEWSRPKNDAGM